MSFRILLPFFVRYAIIASRCASKRFSVRMLSLADFGKDFLFWFLPFTEIRNYFKDCLQLKEAFLLKWIRIPLSRAENVTHSVSGKIKRNGVFGMIEVQNLTKSYGDKHAVNDISFTVNSGEILGFLGPNGAGKSTTMNILTGYISSTSGVAKIDGYDILENPTEAKKKVGYLPEHPPLYLDMTVDAYLEFVYHLKKVELPMKSHIANICKRVRIEEVRHRLIKNLSKGYKQRVGLAQALIGNPPVLILDEPTVGLDPKQIIEIRNLIKELGEEHTVILSSHILSEVQAICDRVIVINQGVLVADGTADDLSKKMTDDFRYIVRIEGPEGEVLRLLRAITNMVEVQPLGQKEPGVYEYSLEAAPGTDVRRELFKRLVERNYPLLGLRSTEMTLEDIFLQLTDPGAHSKMGGEE